MRKYGCAGVAVLLVLAVAGCGASKGTTTNAASGGAGSSKSYPELRWGLEGGFPAPIDCVKICYGQSATIESLAVQSLMVFEPDGKVKPGLAGSVEQPNPTTYVYHLKSAKFSDGNPLTAADVVFSLERSRSGKESVVKGQWADVASISAPNSTTVVIKLKRPSATFQDIVAAEGHVIERRAAEESTEKELGTPGHMLIGTGPWRFAGYTPEVGVQLSRNPYWTGSRQPADKISIQIFKNEASMALALRSDAIDGVDEYVSPKPFADIPGARRLSTSGEQTVLAFTNTKNHPFNDVHVRRALKYATDYKGIVAALYAPGEATEDSSIVPDSLLANLGSQAEVDQMIAALPKYEFDLTKARQELAKSAYPHGFSTTIEVTQGWETGVAASQILSADLAKIGINAPVHEASAAEETKWLTGKGTGISLTDAGVYYPDPLELIEERLGPNEIYPLGAGANVANYRNPEFDKLLSEAGESVDKHERLQMIGDLLRIVANEVPDWPLYSPGLFATLSDKYVLPGFSYWTQLFSPWALHVKLAS